LDWLSLLAAACRAGVETLNIHNSALRAAAKKDFKIMSDNEKADAAEHQRCSIASAY
jgi:hypothetical protein